MGDDRDRQSVHKPLARCNDCDREMHHYNTFLLPSNEERVICWECLARTEKGFFAKRDFRRAARWMTIER